MTYVETRITTFVAEKIRKKWAIYAIVAFFVLQTMVKILICSSCQDTIFGGLFALILIHLVDLSDDPEKYLARRRNLVILPLLIFFMMAIRNNGLYAMVVAAIVGMIVLRKYWKKAAVIFILPIVVFEIYTGPIFDVLGVKKSTDAVKEMNSIPAQQIARAFHEHPEKYSKEERAELDVWFYDSNYFINSLARDPMISDARKNKTNTDYLKEHPLEYLKFWVKVGVKSPTSYVEGFMLTNMGYYYPFKYWNDIRQYHPLIEATATEAEDIQTAKFHSIGMPEKSLLKEYKSFLVDYVGNMNNRDEELIWIRTPLLILLQPGTYFLMFVLAIAVCIIRKDKRAWVPLGLVVGLYITLLLSPVVLFRYVFPVVLSAPVWVALAVKDRR